MKKLNVRAYVVIGMLSSLAFILMLIKFPLPMIPPFLKVDFSDIPALIAAFLFGPVAAILVELFKNVLDYLASGSETGIPIGHFSNFVAGLLFVLPAYFVFKRLDTRKGLVFSLISGTIIMAVFMSILNYFVIFPAYTRFVGWDPMTSADLRQFVVAAILPFNLAKGIIVTVIYMLIHSKMHVWLAKQSSIRNV